MDGEKVIAADSGDEKSGGGGRLASISKVFDKVKKLTRFAANRLEEAEIFFAVERLKVVVVGMASFVVSKAVVKKIEKSFVPSHGGTMSLLRKFARPISERTRFCALRGTVAAFPLGDGAGLQAF